MTGQFNEVMKSLIWLWREFGRSAEKMGLLLSTFHPLDSMSDGAECFYFVHYGRNTSGSGLLAHLSTIIHLQTDTW